MELRADARGNPGITAACLLALLGRERIQDDDEHVRAYTFGLLLAEHFEETRAIRKLLTA